MDPAADLAALLARARDGERGALARLLTIAENGGREAARLDGACLLPPGTRMRTIGITGAPGAGKSTLTAELARHARGSIERLAVLAVDPSSPLTRGAILGDRVRMHGAAVDAGVFIRSMASRGHQGGLALASALALRVFEQAGWPWLLLETVGIGQVEVEISTATDLVVVVLNPGWGDEIQANKAGLMEIADIFVINKADRDGTAQTRRDLESAMATRSAAERIPIVETVATRAEGIAALWELIVSRHAEFESAGVLARRRAARLARELEGAALARLQARLASALAGERGAALRAAVARGELGLQAAAAQLVESITEAED